MFAVITPALISGAFAERMKFSAYLVFTLLWATFVYDPVAHWVWGTGGWIKVHLGALDFAGGLVVHLISGVAALCCVLVMGKRQGAGRGGDAPAQPDDDRARHRRSSGSAGSASTPAAPWRRTRRRSPRSSTPTPRPPRPRVRWSLIEWLHKGKATVLGACSGAVAGLVAITPAAGFVTPMGAHGDRPARLRASATARSCSRASSATTTRSTSSASTASAGPSAPWPSASSPRPASAATSTACLTATPSQLGNQAISVVAAGGLQLRRHLRPPQAGRRW